MKKPAVNPFDARIAPHYEAWYQTPEGQRADALEKALLDHLLAGFPQARSVLEVGCGTGHFTRWLAGRGLRAVGLDISPAMLAEARRLEGKDRRKTIYVLGDAHHLPFPPASYDLVVMVTTLEFLSDPEQALREAARVARQGLILGVLNRWSVLGLQRRVRSFFQPTVYDAARFYGVGELKALLRRTVGRDCSLVWYTTLFPSWSGLDKKARVGLPWGGFIGISALRGEHG